MIKPLEGRVFNCPRSYTTIGGLKVTVFELEVDKDKLDGRVMPNPIQVTIQEKVTIEKGKRIRGFYDTNSTSIFFSEYQFLDEEGEKIYENSI